MCINFLISTPTYSNIGFLISKKKIKSIKKCFKKIIVRVIIDIRNLFMLHYIVVK